MRRIIHQGMARLASNWPYLSDRLTANFKPLELETIPWVEVTKPLHRSKIALVTTAGIHHRGQQGFNMTDSKGDPSFRVLNADSIENEYTITHDYYDHRDIEKDLNVVFPITRLKEMATAGCTGAVSDFHYSFMGHILAPHIDTLEPKRHRRWPPCSKRTGWMPFCSRRPEASAINPSG